LFIEAVTRNEIGDSLITHHTIALLWTCYRNVREQQRIKEAWSRTQWAFPVFRPSDIWVRVQSHTSTYYLHLNSSLKPYVLWDTTDVSRLLWNS